MQLFTSRVLCKMGILPLGLSNLISIPNVPKYGIGRGLWLELQFCIYISISIFVCVILVIK